MRDYREYVHGFVDLVARGHSVPLGNVAPLPRPQPAADAPCALIFSPHPDDECIIGGLAFRMMHQAGYRIYNVAVTQGSNAARQSERLSEVKAACEYLGFDLIQIPPNGLEGVNEKSRGADPAAWRAKVEAISEILVRTKPRVIFFPHEFDWNSSHIGVHRLIVDALAEVRPANIVTVETEFWGQMMSPNLMVELTESDVTALVTATSFHVGEVRRNPYHLLLPGWMMDNVRRGAELVGGQGGAAPNFKFATLYRVRAWRGANWAAPERCVTLPAAESPLRCLPIA